MYRKIKQLIAKDQHQKVLIKNFSYLFILQVFSYIFPLLTIPYLAHVIGVSGFGKIAFAAAIIVWFQTIVDWGFNYTGTRDIARNKDDLNIVSSIFSNIFWIKICLAIISFIFLLILTTFVSYFKENQLLLIITYFLIPGRILFADWFFQAIEKMKFITILDLVSKLIFTLAIFIFIKKSQDYIIQPLLLGMSYMLVGLISLILIIFKFKVKIISPNFKQMIDILKNSSNIFLNNLVPNLYNSFSSVLLGMWSGAVSNGLLDAGTKFANIAQQFTNIISRVFFPFLSRNLDKHDIYVKINIALAFVASILLFLTAPIIIRIFFTPEFYPSITILKIMSWSIFFLALNSSYGLNYMILNGFEKVLRNITFICSFIGFLLAFPLIYFYDAIGAAITITVARGILGFSIMFKAKSIQRSVK